MLFVSLFCVRLEWSYRSEHKHTLYTDTSTGAGTGILHNIIDYVD